MYFIDTGDTQVVGASPEILARLQYDDAGRGTVTVRPLAGTRPRGKTPEEDAALEAELLADPKERSDEHTSELQSLMRISNAVSCLKQKSKSIHVTDHKQ